MSRSFQRLGGSYQLLIRSSDDFASILSLDESQWAATSAPIESLNCDQEFLAFVDDDFNGRVRTDEIKRAISWLLSVLKDRSGIDQGSSTLKLASIDLSSPDGPAILAAAELALKNLGLKGAQEITLAQIRDRQKIISDGLRNGDGVIPPESIADNAVSLFIKDVMEAVGKRPDAGGKDGVDKDLLDRFIKEAEPHLKWLLEAELHNGASSSAIMPFGPESHEMRKSIAGLRSKIDEYFDCCKALAMPSKDSAERFSLASTPDGQRGVDPLNAVAMKSFLDSAPLAEPRGSCVLPLRAGVNPLWQAQLAELSSNVLARAKMPDAELSLADWERLKALFEPYENWLKRKCSGLLDKIPLQRLSDYLDNGLHERLRSLIEEDLAVAKEMRSCDLVRKLILYQANFLEFCNNFVCLKSLFNPERASMIQAGRLIMDGRHFTLATRVSDIDEHKKIAVRSDICIMYLTLSTGVKDKLRTMKIAVGVTSGFMGNLYVGKNGVFFTPDGAVWDAKVVDLLSQPVSFSEALRMPFYKVGEFMGKQADRFFSTKSKEIEDKASQLPAMPQPQQQAPKQNAVNGSMLLMGGGVGIAALGTSFAFMAQALSGVTLAGICTLVGGVMLIFGGPVVAVSVYKLWKRNIAMFLEAGGWALNEPLRMTRMMGLIFTHRPELPGGSQLLAKDLVSPFFKTLNLAPSKARRWRRIILVSIALGLLLGFAAWLALDVFKLI